MYDYCFGMEQHNGGASENNLILTYHSLVGI